MSMPETRVTEVQASRHESEGPNSSETFVLVDEAHRNDTATTGTRRVNVNFAPSAYATLERLAARKDKTMSEVLRDAIQMESWLANAEDDGWHILLERDGRVRELVRP